MIFFGVIASLWRSSYIFSLFLNVGDRLFYFGLHLRPVMPTYRGKNFRFCDEKIFKNFSIRLCGHLVARLKINKFDGLEIFKSSCENEVLFLFNFVPRLFMNAISKFFPESNR